MPLSDGDIGWRAQATLDAGSANPRFGPRRPGGPRDTDGEDVPLRVIEQKHTWDATAGAWIPVQEYRVVTVLADVMDGTPDDFELPR